MQNRKDLNATQVWWPQVDELVIIWQEVHMAYLKAVSLNLVEITRKWHVRPVHFTELRKQDSAVQSSSGEQYHRWVVKFCCLAYCHSSFVGHRLGSTLEYSAFCCVDAANTADATLCLVKKRILSVWTVKPST